LPCPLFRPEFLVSQKTVPRGSSFQRLRNILQRIRPRGWKPSNWFCMTNRRSVSFSNRGRTSGDS